MMSKPLDPMGEALSVYDLAEPEKHALEELLVSIAQRAAEGYRENLLADGSAGCYFVKDAPGDALMVGFGSLYDGRSYRTLSTLAEMVEELLDRDMNEDEEDEAEHDALLRRAAAEFRAAADRIDSELAS